MKKLLIPLAFLCAVAVGFPVLAAKKPAPVVAPIDDEAVVAKLLFMREEEKLAHDVYAVLDRAWGEETSTFDNIMDSEARHTESVRKLLEKYAIPDPVIVDDGEPVEGEFWDQDLQELFNDLVEQGDDSLVAALKVGEAIEVKDIEDIQAAIDYIVDADLADDYPDIIQVYSNLLAGSENHLLAFRQALDAVE